MLKAHFDSATGIMDLSLAGLRMHSNTEIGRLYDAIEDGIVATGQPQWYFLVEMGDLYVNPAVWSYWANRGRLLNLGHSLGTVRYGAAPESRTRLQTAAKAEGFDPNLCATREDALARIQELKLSAPQRPEPTRSLTFHKLFERVTFQSSDTILDVDMSDLTLQHSVDVQDLYDHIETRILCMAPQLRWYFLVNYKNVQINPTVASQFDIRGRSLNQRYSKGSARYGLSLQLQDEIHMRAETRRFDPNVFATRDEALAHLIGMRQAAE